MTVRQIAVLGDSLLMGTTGGFNQALGGAGCAVELVAERLANVSGIGPLISSGFRGCNLGFTASGFASEWTVPATTTSVVSTKSYDVYPYTAGRWSNGASKVWTWTKPRTWRPIVGFALYWVDFFEAAVANGGDWQYRVDGGTWTNMGQTLAHNNKLSKFYVSTAVASTVDIRASSDASTGVDCFPAGIEVYYLAPSTAQGLIVHNISVNGSLLHEITATTSGDRLAFLDAVQLGTGSPVSPTPNAGVVMMHINDVARASTTEYNTDLTTLNTRASPLGRVGLINPYECNTAAYNQTQQTNYRSQLLTTAAAFATPAKTLDIYAALAGKGWTANTGIQAGGLLYDLTHPSQLGHQYLAELIYWFVRNDILAVAGGAPTSYPVTAHNAAAAYSGAKASVAYSACQPISVG